MTLMIGGRYRDGVIVCYDTASLKKAEEGYVIHTYTSKFRRVADTPVAMGVAGTFEEDIFDEAAKRIEQHDDIIEGIDRFVASQHVEPYDRIFFPGSSKSFLFTSRGRGDVELRWADNNYNHKSEAVPIVGMGFGYYLQVKAFCEKSYSPGLSEKSMIELLREAAAISKRLNAEDERSKDGYVIKGLALVRVTPDDFRLLDFLMR